MADEPVAGGPDDRGQWKSRAGFILAAAGSAVGLGNIWKFPYITGENGGGLFVIIYLACIALVGLPIMIAELMIGRAARKQPVIAFQALEGKKTGWSVVGWIGVIAGFLILSFYVVVAGWAMDYTLKSVTNFTAPIAVNAEKAALEARGSVPTGTQRDAIVAERARHLARPQVDAVRREAPKSAWAAWDMYSGALAAAEKARAAREAEARADAEAKAAAVKQAQGDAAAEEEPPAPPATADGASKRTDAAAVLLESPELAGRIEVVKPLVARIEAIEANAAQQASAEVGAMSDRDVRDAFETQTRRAHIADNVGKSFGSLVGDGWTTTFWAVLFMFLTILVVGNGISGGIERVSSILMPTLMLLIGGMVVYGFFQRGFGEAATFVFSPDPSRLKASGVLEALGHAFFTLSIGMGAMITYGSYLRGQDSLARQAFWIAGLDTAVALMACLMIFPIIFSYGQEPGAGPGLVFQSMPLAFAEIGAGGMLLAIVFFGLLTVAALTSAISLLEVVASYFIDARGWSRRKAAWIVGGAIMLFALPSAFSWDPDFLMGSWNETFGHSFFDTMDYVTSNWLLPIGGLLVAIYAGWFMPKRIRVAELEGSGALVLRGWLGLIRFVAPALVLLVLLQKVGILAVD